ncbi:MAG: DedA family protein [Flavobacteriales bacterium]|nr:DedA family protein [Flavobacteriales bacterium]
MDADTLAAVELWANWESLGMLGLFLGSFIAATVLPFSSEALLLAFCAGPWGTWELLVAASAGNWLGGMSSYGLGRLGDPERMARWARVDPATASRWKDRVIRFGPWAALLCWMPIIGDPIAVALGLGRARLWPTALLMLAGKAARYAVLIAALR